MAVPISNVTRRVVFSASGTGPYNFTFEILANTDIAVYKDDALLTLTTDYTVTINANGTGSITLTASPTGATQIAIVGNRTIQRTTDFVTGGDFFANTVNDEMDQQTIFAQQNAEGLGRALQAPQTDPTTIDMTLPRASIRASKVLSFDANGNPSATEFIGSNRGNWASGTLYYVRDIIKDTSTSNIWQCVTEHTSSGSQPIASNADAAKWFLLVNAAAAGAAQTAAEAAQAAAETAQAAAETAETNAETAETNAETAATAAASSASAASTSATNAASSASTASTAATNAGNSATSAASSASSASSSASSASSSASSASTSASNASTSASNASTSATNAASSASSASSSASTATTQATNAATSATAAASSASSASSSASAASTSASNAATSETNAAASAASAASALDSFDDRYLGSKSSDPTVDNDGNALVTGALYYNSSTQTMKVYDGANWIAATAAGTTAMLVYKYVATAGQTTFGGAATVGGTLSYTSGNIIVFLNGASLDSTDYTATNGTSVVLNTGAALSDEIVIIAFKSFTVADAVSKSGDTMTGSLMLDNGAADGAQLVLKSSGYSDWNLDNYSGRLRGYYGSTEYWTVDASGNVGIGTSSPATKADIVGASGVTSFTGTSFLGLQVRGATSTNDYSGIGFSTNGQGSPTAKIGAYFSGSGSYLQFGTSNSYGSGVTNTAMTIDFSGNVGIGTSSPNYKLDLNTASNTTLMALGNKDSRRNYFKTSSISSYDNALFTIYSDSGVGNFAFENSNGELARIDSNGCLRVGATSGLVYGSFEKLTVSNPSGNAAVFSCGGNTYPAIYVAQNYGSGTQTYMYFVYNGTSTGSILSSGSTTVYSTSSDYRLKENIQPLVGALSKVMQLNPVSYTWKSSGEADEGFIAHELQEVCPSAVTGEKDAVNEDGSIKPQGIDTSFLVATLTAAIQELKAINDAQAETITALTARVTALEQTQE